MNTTLSLGVIVGRFQVPELHEGHHALFSFAQARHDQLLIVLGSSLSWATDRNPLSYKVRAAMIRDAYPNAVIVELFDHQSDDEWSSSLDRLIMQHCPGNDATLYGSRDSFLGAYTGCFRTEHMPPHGPCNGTELRETCLDVSQTSAEFRRGLIHAQQSRAPIPYPAVDFAVIDHKAQRILLGHKPEDGDKLRFVGGFVDTMDQSFEAAALRELREEAGTESPLWIEDLRVVGSTRINDWRYRGTRDTVMTTLFRASYTKGSPTASDDIDHLYWVPITELLGRLAEPHLPLGRMLLAELATSEWAGSHLEIRV